MSVYLSVLSVSRIMQKSYWFEFHENRYQKMDLGPSEIPLNYKSELDPHLDTTIQIFPIYLSHVLTEGCTLHVLLLIFLDCVGVLL